jgi:hypothetical protein
VRLLTEGYQPYISVDTAKYSTSAHVPISAAPAIHSSVSTITTGISENRSKARSFARDKRAEVLGGTDVAFAATSPTFACSVDIRPALRFAYSYVLFGV